jgi:hypothetical protein
MPITKTTKRMTRRIMVLLHNKRRGHNIMKATHQKNKKTMQRKIEMMKALKGHKNTQKKPRKELG